MLQIIRSLKLISWNNFTQYPGIFPMCTFWSILQQVSFQKYISAASMPAINIWQSDLKYEKSIPSISCHQDFNISQLIGVCTAAPVISDMIPLIGKWLRFKPSSCTCHWVLLKQDSFLNSPQKPTHQKSVCGKIRLDVSWFIPIWHRFNPIALITKFLQIYFQFIKWK